MYTDYYGLGERPFQLTPDARFYFSSRSHKKAMAYLGYGLAQGEGFIVITGDVGAGKSTLVAHLMATIDRARLNAVNLVSTQVGGDDMLRLAAQKLGIDSDGVSKAALLDRVEAHLIDESKRGKRTLLIVDEAQNLGHSALEELRMLSNYQLGGRALLQIFLLGQPEFRDDMAQSEGLEQLRQRVIATHHLGPMDAEELEAYLTHRIAVAGGEGRPAFDIDAVAAIHRHSGGVPRRVNQLANRLLLAGAMEGRDAFDGAFVDRIADDMAEDTTKATPANVLPLRSPAAVVESATPAPAQPDPALERRVAQLEARLEEQERAIRRVLTLLVDWVEGDMDRPNLRHDAA